MTTITAPTRSKQASRRMQATILLGTALLLQVPLLGMLLTGYVNWGLGDFIAAGVLLAGTGLAYELGTRRLNRRSHRLLVGATLGSLLLVVWAELAVGLFH